MALHTASDLSVAKFCAATLGALGIAQHRVARWFGVGARSVRRWRDGTRRIPRGVDIVLRLLAAGAVTVAQVEEAANGGAKGEPPAPLRAEPAPEEQSASAPRHARTAARADLGLTTAEKLLALVPGTCHWPLNDPRDRDFHFCGAPVVVAPYCPRHALQAHLAPRTGGGHGVRIGFVVHGRHGRVSATGASRAPKILFDRAGDLPGHAPPPV
jgi:hypothetical protein